MLKDLFYSCDKKELGRCYNQFKVKVKTAQIHVEKRNANGADGGFMGEGQLIKSIPVGHRT